MRKNHICDLAGCLSILRDLNILIADLDCALFQEANKDFDQLGVKLLARFLVHNRNGSFYSYISGKKTSKDGRIARYGYMLASGYSITAKDPHKYLTFNINGKWVKKKSVTVAPRDFMEEPIDRYMMSGDLKARIDKAFDKQLEKVAKKLGVSA